MTTKKELALLGRVAAFVYGPRWQRDLARDMKVNDRTVRAWLDGLYSLNPRVWPKLLGRLDRKLGLGPILRMKVRKLIRTLDL